MRALTTPWGLAAAVALATACSHPAPPRAPAPTGGTIAGSVHDASSGDALSFADIEITEWGSMKDRTVRSASSRADGKFALTGLRKGLYMVDVHYGEHRVRVFAVPVNRQDTTLLKVTIDTGALSSDQSYQYVDMAKNPVTTAGPAALEQHGIAAARTGAISGVVTEIASKQRLPGAVVAATTPGVRDAQLAIADDKGDYQLRGLPPGTYTLSVYYHLVESGNIEVRRTGVAVTAGHETVVDLQLDAVTEE